MIISLIMKVSSHELMYRLKLLTFLNFVMKFLQIAIYNVRVNAHEAIAYTATMIELSEEFKRHLQDKYQRDLKLQKVLDVIANNNKLSSENRAKLSYKSEKNLLYQTIDNENCLCISHNLIHEILKLIHNFIHYNFNKFLQNLAELFIYKEIKLLKQFIDHCLQCKFNHSK